MSDRTESSLTNEERSMNVLSVLRLLPYTHEEISDFSKKVAEIAYHDAELRHELYKRMSQLEVMAVQIRLDLKNPQEGEEL